MLLRRVSSGTLGVALRSFVTVNLVLVRSWARRASRETWLALRRWGGFAGLSVATLGDCLTGRDRGFGAERRCGQGSSRLASR